MKAEAVKRGQPYSMYEVNDDEFDFDMTTINHDLHTTNMNITLNEDSLLKDSRDLMAS